MAFWPWSGQLGRLALPHVRDPEAGALGLEAGAGRTLPKRLMLSPLYLLCREGKPVFRSQGLNTLRLSRWPIIAAVVVCLAFALVTDHRWEDYYITYRVSKNLAVGNGLVFDEGLRLHTFTSPIGVLLPALAAKVTGSDEQALWLFRVWSIAAFAGAVWFLVRTAQALRWSAWAAALLPLWLILDAKSVDFAINGMETAFMLLLLAATVHTLATGRGKFGHRLGVIWGLLMWTRPDAFVFGGAISLAWLAILPSEGDGAPTRREVLVEYLRAVVVAALIYLPWFAWAWWYYGTPVPHTIVAKGLNRSLQLSELWRTLAYNVIGFPWRGATRDVFAPSYATSLGGWPTLAGYYWVHAAWVALVLWVLPWCSRVTRALSLAFLLALLYGMLSPVYPWYLPSHGIFALAALASALNDGLASQKGATLCKVLGIGHVLVCAGLLAGSAYQLRHQQRLIEGQRKEIGLWLREQAQGQPQTVFLECVGYIGYFSGLRMTDYPGLTCPPMVEARRALGDANWASLIEELKPDWLVLRPHEALGIAGKNPRLLTDTYSVAKRFDANEQIDRIGYIPGVDYLRYDALFTVYRRTSP